MSYNRNAENQRRLKLRYQPRYRNPIYFDEEKGRWMHYDLTGAQHRKYVKRKASKRARRNSEVYQQKGFYRKKFYIWNEMF